MPLGGALPWRGTGKKGGRNSTSRRPAPMSRASRRHHSKARVEKNILNTYIKGNLALQRDLFLAIFYRNLSCFNWHFPSRDRALTFFLDAVEGALSPHRQTPTSASRRRVPCLLRNSLSLVVILFSSQSVHASQVEACCCLIPKVTTAQ